ncbi:MAG TPA: SemiSWEET family transporter [Candidatus Nanoarchaeia archaeon]|nr:SemiSWEET family transporter [Candidatus Nanoarchaeia archaeon]
MVAFNPDMIGYLAALFGTFIMLPQLIKSLRTRSVEDISALMLAIYIINCVLWTTYGILIKRLPVSLSNGIACLIVLALFIVKMKYSRK